MPRNKEREDVRVEVWLRKSVLKKAKKEASRRGISRKILLEESILAGLPVLQNEHIPEFQFS